MMKGGKWLQQLDKRHSVLGHRVLGGCWWPLQIHARSNRNAGRHHRGFAGDFPRNPQASFSVARIVKCSPKTLRKRYRDDLDFGVAEANAIVSGSLFAAANVVAQIFWLKTRAQWRERPAPDDRAAGGDADANSPVSWCCPTTAATRSWCRRRRTFERAWSDNAEAKNVQSSI